MKVKRSYSQMIVFSNVANNYLANQPKDVETKLTKSIVAILKQCVPFNDDYNEELEILKLDNCLVDPTNKKILKDSNGNYEFTVEGRKKFNTAFKELSKKEVEIHSRITPGNDDFKLTPMEREHFSELVISKQEDSELTN